MVYRWYDSNPEWTICQEEGGGEQCNRKVSETFVEVHWIKYL